jgi:hypothetical protein
MSTRSAIATHRQCAAKNLDTLLAAQAKGTPQDLAVAAEKSCVLEREALRDAIETENKEGVERGVNSKQLVEGYAYYATRLMQDKLVRDLVVVQEFRRAEPKTAP